MAESIRMQQLKKLAGAMPIANQQVASGLQQAAATQFQSAIKGAQPGMGVGTAQQTGAQAAATQAAPLVQAAQQTQQQVGQVQNLAQNQAGIESQQRLGKAQSGLAERGRAQADALAKLNNNIKNELLDSQLQFAKDERGRTLLNDRQLADAAILNAKSEEDILNYKQSIQQMNARKLQTMQAAYHKLAQAMQSGVDSAGRQLDFQTRQQIKTMMTDAEKAIQAEKNRIEANTAMWGAAGTLVGSIVGAVAGGASGAKAGGQIGGAGGGYAGSQG